MGAHNHDGPPDGGASDHRRCLAGTFKRPGVMAFFPPFGPHRGRMRARQDLAACRVPSLWPGTMGAVAPAAFLRTPWLRRRKAVPDTRRAVSR